MLVLRPGWLKEVMSLQTNHAFSFQALTVFKLINGTTHSVNCLFYYEQHGKGAMLRNCLEA